MRRVFDIRFVCCGHLLGLVALAGEVPKTWDDRALANWATPVAELNVRPGHFSEEEYYRAPIDNLRTYPVYDPRREPAGYWEMLTKIGPKPLIEPETIKTPGDWIRAGKRVFEEYDVPAFRTYDAKVIAAVRSPENFAQSPVLRGIRWVPTTRGLALSPLNCGNCHTRSMPDGTLRNGAPVNEPGATRFGPAASVAAGSGSTRRSSPFPFPPPDQMSFWQAWAVPWIRDDIHESAKSMPLAELGPVVLNALAPGLAPRWNSSPYYPTKTPDLIGLKDRKYIDHTATHLHRGPGDLMRYAALVTYADSSDFGPHRMLTDEQRKIMSRLPDEALYALAQYIYSLEPPANPNKSDPRAAAGAKIFDREGCATCHTPPLYTNNKLTLAFGFRPPKKHFQFLDIMPVSVRTDPGLALKTRKGTGYYKVPSLKGVWYRGRYLHDSAVTTLEELFDAARLKDDFVPTGFKPVGVKTRAVKGHEFGLRISLQEREALIAFLRTL